MTRIGDGSGLVSTGELAALVATGLADLDLDGASVCLVIPDATRHCPVPVLLDAVRGALGPRVRQVEAIVALGTHHALGDAALAHLVGAAPGRITERHPGLTVRNHDWADPATFSTLGTLPADRVRSISGGRLAIDVPVRVNRAVVDADLAMLIGPVLPHEVVGFSGGNKYLFPGLSGEEMIDVTHWLGALISSAAIIGTPGVTPVRALIDAAAGLVPTERRALCVVTTAGDGLAAAAFGTPEVAWAEAAEVAARTHVEYLDAPVANVLSVIPERYDDLWTAAKGFYKVEPVVADGGRVVLYAPHLRELTPMHPGVEEIGYHTIDYFTGQWERFAHRPWGELAHSTHLRGAGTWDPVGGEQPRVAVTLASAVSEARTRRVGLDWADPAGVDVAAYEADPEWLVVHDAGEVLYRLHP